MEDAGTENISGQKKKKSLLRKLVLRFLLFILMLFGICSALLYIPFVQNYAVDFLTSRFSKTIDANLSIGDVRLNIFKGVVVHDIDIIEKTSPDTILHIGFVNSGFKDNLISLLKRKLTLETLELGGITVLDVKGPEDKLNRLTEIFAKKITDEDPELTEDKQAQKPWIFDVQNLILNDINYNYIDSVKGQKIGLVLKRSAVAIDFLDLDKKFCSINSIKSDGTRFHIEFFNKSNFEFIEESIAVNDTSYSVPDTFNLFAKEIKFTNSAFYLDDHTKTNIAQINDFDAAHIYAEDLKLHIENFHVNSFAELEAKITAASLRSRDEQIVVEAFKCGNFSLSKRRMTFDSLLVKTNNSTITDQIVFKFRDLRDFNGFNDKVILEGNLANGKLGIKDLLYFAPALRNNKYFVDNADRYIDINGIISGKVNSLNADNMVIRLGNEIVIRGRMNSRNLTDVNNSLLNLDLKEFTMSVATLGALIPGFNPPQNFYKLGKIRFNGRFDGYFQDFVAYGDFISNLGSAELDMRLDLKDGAEQAKYSGKTTLKRFDLATWSGNKDFGLLEVFAEVENGKGLRAESIKANLKANVNLLEYKGYLYKDFKMNGKFERNLFDGTFVISDPNVDLNFKGTINFADSIPVYNFEADINALKLRELHIIEDDFAIKGKMAINATGTDLNNGQGTALGKAFVLTRNGKDFEVDSFDLNAKGTFPNQRNFSLNSSLVDVELNGLFKVEELPDAFITSIKQNYPAYTKNLNVIKYENPAPGYDFNINLKFKESEDIFEVFFDQSIFINNASLLGRISDVSKRSALDVDFPYLEVNGNIFEGIKGDLSATSDEGELNLAIRHMHISNTDFKPVEISATVSRENLSFVVNTAEVLDSFTNVKLEGLLQTKGELIKVNLQNTGFEAFGSTWKFNNTNNLVLGNKTIIVDGLKLTDGVRTLSFDDINEKGLKVDIENLNFAFISKLIASDKVNLFGAINGFVEIDNVFEFNGMNASLELPGFRFNKHSFGKIVLQAASNNLNEPIGYELIAIDDYKNLTIKGAYDFKKKINTGEIRINKYPLDLLEYIVTSGISETYGTVTGTFGYSGPADTPEVFGYGVINNGGTKIDYLGVKYKIGDNVIKLNKGIIDFTNCELIDSEGHKAIAKGSLKHKGFRNFSADINLKSKEFIALNTTKKDNPAYYGFAKGQMDVAFQGPLEAINITVNATTGKNTKLHIPVEYTTEEISTSFIEIINKEQRGQPFSSAPVAISGLKLDMNVNVTEESEVIILFDETAKDILQSRGRGAIQLSIDQDGNFEMYGDYEVVSGQYLFTIPSLAVNKSFIIRNGGNIQWTGDPIDANLKIQAEYKGLQTSLAPFLQEYIPDGNERLANQAQIRTEVSLALDLGGTISNPDLDFKISFPNLTGDLKPMAEGKLRTLEANQDAYNEQVFGLILLRQFLPSNNALANNILNTDNIVGTGYSTISEFVSNQFSILLTSLFDEALGDNSYFSGIDVSFAASKGELLIGSGILPDEYDFNFRSSFDENKWNIQIGGKYVVRDITNSGNQYVNPNFIFEYYVTEDRRLKLNVYAKYDFTDSNAAFLGRKFKSGVGLSYRKEFNSLFDFAQKVNSEATSSDN